MYHCFLSACQINIHHIWEDFDYVVPYESVVRTAADHNLTTVSTMHHIIGGNQKRSQITHILVASQ